MHLYSLTLQRATAITHAIYGNFSDPKAQELVVARGKILELLRPTDSGKVQTILSVEIFGVIRSLLPFRLTGDNRDYVIVGSDSGRIVILQYNPDKNTFDKIHQETFGKTGCRRIVPGQYLAVDPKGRAVMIAAVEKQKLVYILNRDSAARLTISSPLEAHKSSTIIYSITGVDVGFDNPIFASIELSYADADQDPTGEAAAAAEKHLTFYELDLGLNNVVRKWSEPIHRGANMLLAVPGGTDGPGGVLICCENYLIWKNQGKQEIIKPIPRRQQLSPDRTLLIVSATMHKQKNFFFFLLQSEYGDLYKVTLEWEDDSVHDVLINYFDTLPVANSLCVLRSGFLFVASEFGNHYLYQISSLGDNEETKSEMDTDEFVYFTPAPLRHLTLIYELESLAPILDFRAADLAKEDTKQIYALCGRGPRSSLRILRQGLAVAEVAGSPLPGNPNGVWTVKRSTQDKFDKYIVVSFVNATLVLAVGEGGVEETTDSGLLGTSTTLEVGLLGDDSIVQVYPTGIRHIRADKRITEWPAPSKRSIVRSAMNKRQLIVALNGGELVYFELDISGQLLEGPRRDIGRDIACLDVAPVPEGRQRSRFLAVGDYDNTVRVLSIERDDMFASLAVQATPAQPESLCILKMQGYASDGGSGTLFLNIGLANGVLQRAAMDGITGELTDTRTRFLGARPVKLFKVVVQDKPAMLALSSRPWLCYTYQLRFQLTPLSYPPLDSACNFASELCPEGFVATTSNMLRIITPERLGDSFNQEEVRLRYTPRKMLVHNNQLIFIETDHNAYSGVIKGGLRQKLLEAQQALPASSAAASDGASASIKKEKTNGDGGDGPQHKGKEKKGAGDSDAQMDVSDEEGGGGAGGEEEEDEGRGKDKGPRGREERVKELEEKQKEQIQREEYERTFGAPKPGAGRWASCIRLLDAATKETVDIVELDNNEAAFSMCVCAFHDKSSSNEPFLVVGTAKDLELHPRRCSGGFIHVYRLVEGKRLSLVHKTPVEDVPLALCAFQGRLLVGVGKVLRIYDLGKKKLLRKCENKLFPQMITNIINYGDRIVVSDIAESFHYVKYKKAENQLFIFADDTSPRWLTASTMLDYDTMAGADKFGNIYIARLPEEVNEEVDDNPTGALMYGRGLLNGAPHKLKTLINFHVGEVINSMAKTTLTTGGAEGLVYTTVMGGMGALVPFVSREDIDFFSHLEMHMRAELPPLCGRDHLSFRSYYFPVKDVIDGDLCEQYAMLPPDKQRAIAEELDRTPSEVHKKLEVIRNSLL